MPRNLPPFVWTELIHLPFEEMYGTQCRIGTWEKSRAWSNGHVMFKGQPPQGVKGEEIKFDGVLKKIVLNVPEVFPVAVYRYEGKMCVVFSNRKWVIQAMYFYYTIRKYPSARFFAPGTITDQPNQAPMLVKDRNRIVAALMPYYTHGPLPKQVAPVLKASARERLKTATDAPKPRRAPKQKSRHAKQV